MPDTDHETKSPEARQAELAPETHNDEQDDHLSQAQEIAQEARNLTPATDRPTESRKSKGSSGIMGDPTQDIVDRMRDMEQSGRIDMDAYRGETNMDDDAGKYGPGHDAEFESDDS